MQCVPLRIIVIVITLTIVYGRPQSVQILCTCKLNWIRAPVSISKRSSTFTNSYTSHHFRPVSRVTRTPGKLGPMYVQLSQFACCSFAKVELNDDHCRGDFDVPLENLSKNELFSLICSQSERGFDFNRCIVFIGPRYI